ncbi:uncharacterized protein LOC113059453 isoform X2 [Carassius auratus]|uniref:Uncharacterized protein LOC113059453 isoform X2 n=1 Tax=Carassius auratus TaxID=7957 RepID=A0A6P6LJN5_CARAU|nr:uncharacterized protein LOC113059453 isoform X2 [Carassius auratus]
MLFCADFCVLGFQCIIVMILHNFWISNVLIQKTEVVEHCTACNNICTKAELTSRALKKKMEHSWSSSSEGSLNNVLCTSIIGVESKLCRIVFRLSVCCDEADEHSHKDTHTISQDVFSCRWIGLQCSSAPWHHTQTRDIQQRYQEGTYHGGDLQLNRMKPLPVGITLGFFCWWFNLYVTAIYCSSYQKKSCFHCLQVICGGEGNQPPQNPHDRLDLFILCTMLCSS